MNLYPKSISIAQIRAIKEWAFSLKGQAKFLLIERGETLSIGATNALLKLLEEPPEDFLCILTTDNKGLLPATLLSRLRTFSFSPYGQEETKAIVEKTYHQTTEALDLKTFFDSFNSQEAGKTLSFAQSFYFALQEREPFPQNLEWSGLFENKEMVRPTLELFLRDLLSLWQKRLGEHPQESSLIAELMRELNVQTERAFTFNQSPQTFLEGLYYRLKKIWIFEEGA
jgi:DNA polymerase III delta prime subunit